MDIQIRALTFSLVFFLSSMPTALVTAETLRLVVWEGYAPEPQRIQFQNFIRDKYAIDIKLEVNYISDIEDYFTALRLKQGDILSPTHNHINDQRFRMIELGLILPVDLNNIPNYAHINPVFQNADYLVRQGKHYGVPFSYGPYALAYNTEQIKTAPTSWKILWDPEYRDQFSITDYGEMNIYITGLVLGYKPEELHIYEKINNDDFRKKLAELAANTHSFWVGVDSADDLQGLSLATSWGFSLPDLKNRGELWELAQPIEGTPGWADSFVISHSLKDKPQLKRIAEEWLNFAISPEFQASVLINGIGVHPVNLQTREHITTEQIKEFHLDEPNYLKNNFIIHPVLDRRTRNGMNMLWHEAADKEINRKKTTLQ